MAQIAYSYVRFSTPEQKLGNSLARQLEASRKYATDHDLTLDESMRDEGLSAYHGRQIKTGTLGRFIEKLKAGEIITPSTLIVEHLDRLDRRAPRIAQEQFLSIVNRGVAIYTLMDGTLYSAESLDRNMGAIFMSIGIMIGANNESEKKAERTRDNWQRIRGTSAMIMPSWIIRRKLDTKPVTWAVSIDEAKADIVRRMFRDALVMGFRGMAEMYNREGVPMMAERKREREAWTGGAIRTLIRSRSALGEQAHGKHEHGKRTVTGEVTIGAYPAIISEAVWQEAQTATESRVKGTVANGRNVTSYANIFGELAKCDVCGARMTVRQKARIAPYKYFSCSNALVGMCEAGTYHNLDRLEAGVIAFLGTAILETKQPIDDKAGKLAVALDAAKSAEITANKALDRLYNLIGDEPDEFDRRKLAQAKDIVREASKATRKAEAELAAATVRQPVSDQWETVKAMLGNDLSSEDIVAMRRKIALTLPSMIRAIRVGTEWQDAPGTIGHKRQRVRIVAAGKPWPQVARTVWTLDWLPEISVTLPTTVAGDWVRVSHARATGQVEATQAGEITGPI